MDVGRGGSRATREPALCVVRSISSKLYTSYAGVSFSFGDAFFFFAAVIFFATVFFFADPFLLAALKAGGAPPPLARRVPLPQLPWPPWPLHAIART